MCEQLATTEPELLAQIRALLAPHGIEASTKWRQWLESHEVPYDFTVW